MLQLVFANLKVRPFRTLISVIGVELGVVLVVLFTGLATGMTNDMARRASNWKAEIVFTRPGAMELQSSNASVSTTYASRLMEIEGVQSTVPVIRYVAADTSGRWGIKQIDGVDWQPFAEMNGMELVEGRAPTANNEIILDEHVPPGSYAAASPTGWKVAGDPPKKFTYLDKTKPAARNGLKKIVITDKSAKVPGMIAVVVDGDRGDYPLAPGETPITVSLELNDTGIPQGSQPGVDQCGEVRFEVAPLTPACVPGATKLTCKNARR